MNSGPLVSIVIDNYNYGRYLAQAIDSALAQTYRQTEVIVVDDGSTDDSRAIIARYGDRVIPIFKDNGGQGSAFNAGFAVSRGEWILFLDSDDMLVPTAIERAIPHVFAADVVKVHWPLLMTDADGKSTGQLCPGPRLAEGDLREVVRRTGPTHHLSAPTSGNLWARWYLQQVMPLPEKLYRYACDVFLFEVAPFFGILKFVPEPQTLYRQHGSNYTASFFSEEKVLRELKFYDHYTSFLVKHLGSQGISVDVEQWKRNSWWHMQAAAFGDIAQLGPLSDPFILIDDAAWEPGLIAGRRPIPFLERNGEYWGPPADDPTAIAELERLRSEGAAHLMIAWCSFWWLDQYPGLREHLLTRYRRVIQNERLIVFDLRQEVAP